LSLTGLPGAPEQAIFCGVEVRATLAADPRCVGEARRVTTTTLNDWGLAGLTDTASLLVSELMTNALLHARSGVDIVIRRDPSGARIEVCDHSPLAPRIRHFSADAGTGRGIRLLDTLASDWGVEPRDGGKCVWFILSNHEPETAADWEFDFDLSAVEAI
jgi:anti-sigma regulatory factor (Ser/Thr protein kinase)